MKPDPFVLPKFKFERKVIDYTWETAGGIKTVTRDDAGVEKPDGPNTTPATPKGWGPSKIEIIGGKWFYSDFDLPSYGLSAGKLPGGKKATYRFKITEIATGMVVFDQKWTLTIDIDAAGKVTVAPNKEGFIGK